MTLDVVRGRPSNPDAARRLIAATEAMRLDHGTLYIGYPILASESGPATVDALLCCPEFGLVAFDMSPPPDPDEAQERHLDIELAIRSRLLKNKALWDRARQALAVPIRSVSYLPETDASELRRDLQIDSSIPWDVFQHLQSTVESVTTLRNVRKPTAPEGSRKATIQRIQNEIANLDRWQKQAAIESPEGPQRIRGIAGSGKTIVLALKAAYLHATNPEWQIAITFYTRSLYQQLRSLITRFHLEHAETEPDWNRLLLLHAWGGRSTAGMYSYLCNSHDVPLTDFNAARRLDPVFPFRGICDRLEERIPTPKRQFDAILVDEAQDVPASFLRLCFKSLRDPKRLVWAYDELQNLTDTQIPDLADIFGVDDRGAPLVDLRPASDWASQDIILPRCYRNPPWSLAAAHAVGFGIYRDGGLIQHFDEPSLWDHIGYTCESGTLRPGATVRIRRKQDCTPSFFENLLTPADALTWVAFDERDEENEWIVAQVVANLEQDSLDPADILIVLPHPLGIEKKSDPIRRALSGAGIASHIAGIGSSVDELFVPSSVAISGIYRAKGNEAPMVYVARADECIQRERLSAASKRNALFTAMTRSRAWLRVCGTGGGMNTLAEELAKVRAGNYILEFKIPTEHELGSMRRSYRDVTPGEKQRVERMATSLRELLDALDRGDILPEDIPDDMKEQLTRFLGR